MKKIKLIIPVVAPQQMIELIREDCLRVKDADTMLDVCAIPWGPEYIEQEYDDIWAALPTLLERRNKRNGKAMTAL